MNTRRKSAYRKVRLGALALGLLGLAGPAGAAEVPAFPGAEGFAAQATGGRGGEIYHVTTLADSGAGSLREAVSKSKRIVVFDVGGYVELKSILQIHGDITLLGQTAPGQGIGTRGMEVSFSGSKNVICRYMRFRQGLAVKEEKKSAVGMHAADNIILDHVSVQWGRWDTVDMTDSKDVTIEYSIIGPGVAPQRFGCLCESDNVTFSHDLWISNESRNPKSKGKIQYINNVIYNWGKVGFVGGHSGADHFTDVVGNYFIKGPSSSKTFMGEFSKTDQEYQEGNLVDLEGGGKLAGRPITAEDFKGASVVAKPWSTLPAHVDTAEAAYEIVAATAGCSLSRDPVDARLIADLTSLGKSGKVVEDPKDMGGFDEITGGPKRADLKDDTALDKDGYMMIEAYANSLVAKQPAGK